MDYKSVKDSGECREASTGAKRDRAYGKGRYDLLPPFAIHRKARHFENGCTKPDGSPGKYKERNWELGMPLSWFINSALHHIFELLARRIDGKEPGEDNAAAAAWNMDCFVETEERIARGLLPKELDNLPHGPQRQEAARVELRGGGEDLRAIDWRACGEE